jgi:diguanylate cyclase (GGDEF)-like protein/PAS domain S-box-containing protein
VRTTTAPNSPPIKVSTGFLVHSLLYVPIIAKGKALGVLSVDNRASLRSFKEIDEAMLTSLADYAAVALENANLYQQAQQEIAERVHAVSALRESEERYILAMRGANDGLWDWDLRQNLIYCSPRWKSMLGFREEEIGDSPDEWFNRVHPEDLELLRLEISNHIKGLTSHLECEQRILHKDGTYHWMQTRGLAVWDMHGIATRMAGSQTDITDRKTAEHRLLHDAFHDTLTGLPNRALFMDRLRFAVERAKRRDRYLFGVLYMDLDRFKDVNDSLGHMMGDQLLVETGHRLGDSLRPTDTVARLGGDEFVLLLEDIASVDDATRVAERVQKHLMTPFRVDGHIVHISASMGIVLSVTGYNRAEEVLRDADIAMYRAKAHGKARFEIFDPAMRDRIMVRLSMETQLRQALDNLELRVYYQPIVSLETGQFIGLEALVRWQHPERGLIYPAEFIPLAEETGLVIPLDRWVLREACRQMREWQQSLALDPELAISVNISGKQVAQPDLVEVIRQILEETGIEGRLLKLEITESAIMENDDYTNEIFSRLQELGVQIQIDDFGIGYSSLSYLPRFPLNALKISQAFVKKMEEDPNLLKIVHSIIMLTHGLGMRVIAEGVETTEQLTRLKSLGCEYGQGYLMAAPMDNMATLRLLTDHYSVDKRPRKPEQSKGPPPEGGNQKA